MRAEKKKHQRALASAEDDLFEDINQQEQDSLNHISLLQDPVAVKDYSKKLQRTIKRVRDTNKMLSQVQDKDIVSKKKASLNEQMAALEM